MKFSTFVKSKTQKKKFTNMTERKKKAQLEESVQKPLSDDFANFFLALCGQYDVSPLPKICPLGITSIQPETSRQKILDSDETAPIIYTSYENPKTLENVQKLECKRYEISVCILDALSLSMKKFDTITTLRFPNCGINAFGIEQIAQILTEVGSVRDLNLDSNPNMRQNYHLLCSPLGKLQYLSLKYCNISDAGVEKIAKELDYKGAKELPQLIGLDLANNFINDIGAHQIARMLHTNRSLQSLILTGNRIGDSGAALIIQELCMYSLTHDEIVELRRLNYSLLMQRQSRSQNVVSVPNSQERSSRNSSLKPKSKSSKRSVTSRRSTNSKQSIRENYSPVIEEHFTKTVLINPHPLSQESRPVKGDIIASGNFKLQHLNLSYNHLTNESLKKVVECLFYQRYMILGDINKGLLYVYLEGNDFQIEGNEDWNKFHELLVQRRSSQSQTDKQQNYEDNVSAEIQILREKLQTN